jgi:hypothetical protein
VSTVQNQDHLNTPMERTPINWRRFLFAGLVGHADVLRLGSHARGGRQTPDLPPLRRYT